MIAITKPATVMIIMSVIMVASRTVMSQTIETTNGPISTQLPNPQIRTEGTLVGIAVNEQTNKI